MLKLGRVTKVKVFFLVLVFVFNFDLFKFLAAILEKGLLNNTRNGAQTKTLCCGHSGGFRGGARPPLFWAKKRHDFREKGQQGK